MWKECLRVLKPGGHLLSFGGTRTFHRMVVAIEDAGFEIRDTIGWVYGEGFPKSLNIEKKIKKYEGWGTALKPAIELISMARKPLSEKNVAENVLKWGTGGINIDKCRIETKPRLTGTKKDGLEIKSNPTSYQGSNKRKLQVEYDKKIKERNYGRFPANLILDGSEEVKKMFPFDKNKRKDRIGYPGGTTFGGGKKKSDIIGVWYGDSGSASRFFKSCPFTEDDIYPIYYCSKAKKKERNMGGVFNTHPTVKPLKLMEYLVLLITPPNGIVLDPFAGSGTTLIAAKKQGFRFIGIELEKEYIEIAKKRLSVIQDKLL